MGSVSSANSALTSMLQTIASSADSPVLSSSSVISSLENSPQDIIDISTAATEMSGIDAEFGITATSSSTGTATTDLNNILSALSSSQSTASSSSSATANTSTAQQLATYEADLQAADTQTLFGTGTTTNSVFG